MKTIFLRALESSEKQDAVVSAIRGPTQGRDSFEIDVSGFSVFPGSVFAYWAGEGIRKAFATAKRFEVPARNARQGLASADDNRFIRTTWEAPAKQFGHRWFFFAKGGAFSPYYADIHLCVNWSQEGAEIKHLLVPGTTRAASRTQNIGFYFQPGLTWSRRTKSPLSMRALPAGCVFGDKGPGVTAGSASVAGLRQMLSLTNSRVFHALVDVQLAAADAKPGGAAHSYEVGIIQRTPVPEIGPEDESLLASLAGRAWSIKHAMDQKEETSHAFSLPALLQRDGHALTERTASWAAFVTESDIELAEIQAGIDDRCFDLYGIGQEDRATIIQGLGVSAGSDDGGSGDEDDHEALAGDAIMADPTILTAELVSWAVGVGFSRFDIRMATGENELPPEPDPFDPLPVCSPGMLTGDDGLPLISAPDGYPIDFPQNGILVDDPGHPLDLTAVVRSVFDVLFGASADDRWQEASLLLDPKGRDLRNWLVKGFFDHHLKQYSKSRRKAPIFWQLATPSANYAVWLYAHRVTPDTFFQVQNEIVGPKIEFEQRQLTTLRGAAGTDPNADQRKEIEAKQTFVLELESMLDEIGRIAALWRPDLNDGVVLTMAPLWRLVPQHKSWQRELRTNWEALASGKYDWAHIAMHLWPERVVSKCSNDRSIAIAHHLEEKFWAQPAVGKWEPRSTSRAEIDALVTARTSLAVQSSIQSLLAAPAPSASRKTR